MRASRQASDSLQGGGVLRIRGYLLAGLNNMSLCQGSDAPRLTACGMMSLVKTKMRLELCAPTPVRYAFYVRGARENFEQGV